MIWLCLYFAIGIFLVGPAAAVIDAKRWFQRFGVIHPGLHAGTGIVAGIVWPVAIVIGAYMMLAEYAAEEGK